MIIVNLKGGLGNQMFQFATGYCLSKRNGTNIIFDTLARRTFDESGDYVVRNFDLDIKSIKKHKASINIYT